MIGYEFSLNTISLTALGSGALWWPDAGLLAVSDLHFGKAHRMARRSGVLLPPYETNETLFRLDADIERHTPATVICLGDSFDDLQAVESLTDAETLWLNRLMAGRQWIWIAGNHDPAPLSLGGSHLAQHTHAGLSFRHIADPAQTAEISGHYHPKARITGTSRSCFLIDDARVILPAYGTYTGGLLINHPALTTLMQPNARAILTGLKPIAMPMPRR